MAYVSPNFKSKKALKEALASGRGVDIFQPAIGTIPDNGTVHLEGPHYPAPHTWYGKGKMVDGVLTSVS